MSMLKQASRPLERRHGSVADIFGGQDAQFGGANCGQYLPRMPTAQLRYSALLHRVRIQGICGLLLPAVGPRQRGRRKPVRMC